MFTLTLTRAERAEIMKIADAHEGPGESFQFLLLCYSRHPVEHGQLGRWRDSDEPLWFTVRPETAVLLLPGLTAHELKQYSPDLANKLAGLRGWIMEVEQAEGG